jgi:hypothetical protein
VLSRLVGEAICKGVKSETQYSTVLMCESDVRKQTWLAQCFLESDEACIFKDISAMGGAKAACCVHPEAESKEGGCPINVPTKLRALAVCGFSCKDLSRRNLKCRGKQSLLSSGGGTTATTFAGLSVP